MKPAWLALMALLAAQPAWAEPQEEEQGQRAITEEEKAEIKKRLMEKLRSDPSFQGMAQKFRQALANVEIPTLPDDGPHHSSSDKSFDLDLVAKDLDGNPWAWQLGWNRRSAQAASNRFGMNDFELANALYSKEKLKARLRIRMMRGGPGYFVDTDRFVGMYQPFMDPFWDLAQRTAGDGATDLEITSVLLRFFQDIPYINPSKVKTLRQHGGVFTPPEVILRQQGDCDSKTLALVAATIRSGPEPLLVLVPGHMLVGFEGVPRPYQKFHEYGGKRYILAEPTGPRRLPLGVPDRVYQRVLERRLVRPAQGDFRRDKILTRAPLAQPSDPSFRIKVVQRSPSLTADITSEEEILPVLFQGKKEIKGGAFLDGFGKKFRVTTSPPKAGDYYLALFTRPKGSSTKFKRRSIIPVFAEAPRAPMPQFYNHWIRGARLVEPRTATVSAERPQKFVIQTLGGEPFIVQGGERFNFVREGGAWTLTAKLKPELPVTLFFNHRRKLNYFTGLRFTPSR